MKKRNVEIENSPKEITAKKICGYVFGTVTAVVLCAVILAFISIFIQISKGEVPSVLGYRIYYVVTDSMTPTISPGDVIISKKLTEKTVKELKVGDIVTYTAQSGVMKGNQITHRIEKGVYFDEALSSYAVVTRGDKQGAALDNPVALEFVNSVYVKKSALLTAIYGAAHGGGTLALIVALPLALMLVCLVIRLVVTLRTPAESGEKNQADSDKIEQLKKQAIEEYLNSRKNDKSE